jgi:4-hydroxy-tetrahydrodipicolinate reductase
MDFVKTPRYCIQAFIRMKAMIGLATFPLFQYEAITMSIRVLVNGANGRMGQASIKAIMDEPGLILVGETVREDDLALAIKNSKAQVVVDFTNAEAVLKNTQIIIDAGVHPIIGTSGLLRDQINQFQAQCDKLKLGGIIAPNFSLGAVLMMKHAQEIAKYFPHVEIIEMHHDGKLDSPSGTALRTAEMLAETRSRTEPKTMRETIPGARGAIHHEVPIHAIRLPGLVAHEQIIFGGVGETLTIRHDSIDRVSFMPGVCLACKEVMHLDKLVYGLEHIL